MMQLSLDGKRLYVSSSLFSPWDKQVYDQKFGNWVFKDYATNIVFFSISLQTVLSEDG